MYRENITPVVIELNSLEKTDALAQKLSSILKEGDLLLFTGEIGTGKTTFIKALAKGLGIKETVTSPTFVIHAIRESGRIPLSHVDLYRLDSDADVENIGFEEYYDTAVTVIEWADRYTGFEEPFLELHFQYGEGENDRTLSIGAYGGDWENRLKAILPE